MKHLLIAVIAIITICAPRAYGHDQDVAKLNRFMQGKSNTASMQIFREGRDFIEAQNWQKAAEKFNDFITAYPKDKDLDAALYWYGYALQKQNRNEDASKPLLRLINRFPGSNWRNDAQALLVVMGFKDQVENALQRENCEIKMLALQSLFQADQDRAINIATESLRTNPTQCPEFQAFAVSMLGTQGGARAIPLLLDIARTNPNVKLRLTAIRILGQQRNDQVLDDLIKIYDTEKTNEIRVQILRALAQHSDPRARAKLLEIAHSGETMEMRAFAIRQLGAKDDEQTVDQLVGMYDSEKDPQVRALLMRSFGDSKQKNAVRKLMTIARNDSSVELRKLAVRYLGESKDPEALKFLEDLLK